MAKVCSPFFGIIILILQLLHLDVDDFTNTLPGASFREAVAQKTSFSNQIIPELDQWNADAFKTGLIYNSWQ